MRLNTFAGLALATLTAVSLPATADAQTPQPERARSGQHGMAQPGYDPATRILELRQELALTQAQVDQIGRIRATLEERNAPLLAQVSESREQMRAERQQLTPEQRAEMREQMRARMQERRGKVAPRAGAAARPGMPEDLRPVLEQLQANTREAMQQIQAVLTETQQQKLRELRPAQRQGGPGMQRMRRDGGEPGVRQGGRVRGAGPGSR